MSERNGATLPAKPKAVRPSIMTGSEVPAVDVNPATDDRIANMERHLATITAHLIAKDEASKASVQPIATAPSSLIGVDQAQASLVKKVLDHNRSAGSKFIVIVVPDDDVPRIEEFATVEELVVCIKSLIGMPCHVYPLLGHRLSVTPGPHKYLNTPYGAVPLFDVPKPEVAIETQTTWFGLSDNAGLQIGTEQDTLDDDMIADDTED